MADLRTDYKDDVLDTSVNTQRKYQMTTNEDGTVSFTDVTEYSQVGDTFGAADVNAMNEAVNSCFQSVSDGKALVASAITDKGVSTAADATFETMADNIGKVVTGKLINLGNGTSWNVVSVCNSNGIDYTKLTTANFIVAIVRANSVTTGTANTSYRDYYGGATGSSGVTYSYSNGSLRVTGGNGQSIYVYRPNESAYSCGPTTQGFVCNAWLFYAG